MYLIVLAAFALAPQQVQPLITIDDYPPVALANGWQGDVGVELSVGENGRVTDCKVLQSSGHRILDSKTCTIMRRRARFAPKADTAGRPVAFTFRPEQPIRWRLGS